MATDRHQGAAIAEITLDFMRDCISLTPQSQEGLQRMIEALPCNVTCSATVTGYQSRRMLLGRRKDLVKRRNAEVARRLLKSGLQAGVNCVVANSKPLSTPRPGRVQVSVVTTLKPVRQPAVEVD